VGCLSNTCRRLLCKPVQTHLITTGNCAKLCAHKRPREDHCWHINANSIACVCILSWQCKCSMYFQPKPTYLVPAAYLVALV